MPYYEPQPIPTAETAFTSRTVDQLKQLATLLPGGSVPTRKAELVVYVLKHLQGDALRNVWNRLDRLQQAAIAEVVHSPTDNFQPERFIAKYGEEPN